MICDAAGPAESPYVIAELREDQPGGYSPRGAVRTLWKTRDFETIVSGPAETGKTFGCLQYADTLLWKYAGAQGVMLRKTYAALIGSAVQTYKRIIGPDSPIKAYGGEKPEWFDYPNGSRLWVAGMDNPGKALSSERDFAYYCQAEELALNDHEVVTTRCTGRGAVMPYTRVFGDCNPGPPRHWIKLRAAEGKLKLLESRHVDNPTLYDDAGNITPQGVRTMAVLDALTGTRKLRLRHGLWVQSEGVVYEEYDPALHLIEPAAVPKHLRRYVASVDWGYTKPGVIQVWGVDGDGRMYRVREVYRTKQKIEWWTRRAVELAAAYPIEHFACDPAEPAFIDAFRTAGLPAAGAYNEIRPGIDAVRERLAVAGDSRPRLFLVNGALDERDEELVAAKQPVGTEEEMGVYAYPIGADGRPSKELPVDDFNHGCFVAGTLVETDAGPVPIERVSAGDWVLTRGGFRPVLAAGVTNAAAVVCEVAFGDGRTLTGTPNHPVWAENKGFIRLDALRYGDTIVTCRANLSNTTASHSGDTPARRIGRIGPTTPRPSTRSSGASAGSTKKSGRPHTARFQPAATSTTRTGTRSTTPWATWSVLPRKNIGSGIGCTPGPKCRPPTDFASFGPVNSRRFGTRATRVANGTASTPRPSTPSDRPSPRFATNAGVPLAIRALAGTAAFAPMLASRRGGGGSESTTFLPLVPPAERSSPPTNSSPVGSAPAVVLTARALPERAAVYNLTVGGEPEYFANGVLVHNCDSARYAVAYVDDLAANRVQIVSAPFEAFG